MKKFLSLILIILSFPLTSCFAQSEGTLLFTSDAKFSEGPASFVYTFPDNSVYELRLDQDFQLGVAVFRDVAGNILKDPNKDGVESISFRFVEQMGLFFMDDSVRLRGFAPIEAKIETPYIRANVPKGYSMFDVQFYSNGIYAIQYNNKPW